MVGEHYGHVTFSFCCVSSDGHQRKDETLDLSFIWFEKQAMIQTNKALFSKLMVCIPQETLAFHLIKRNLSCLPALCLYVQLKTHKN